MSSSSADVQNGRTVDLVSRARNGSLAAVNELLNELRPYLKGFAESQVAPTLRGKVSGSDVVQDTMMKAFINFHEFRGETKAELRGWLVRILRNNSHDWTRAFFAAEKRDVSREVKFNHSSFQQSVESPECTEENAIRREEEVSLRFSIQRLPEPERSVVLWYYEEQVTFAEIARRLECPPETARRHWYRAVEILKVFIIPDAS